MASVHNKQRQTKQRTVAVALAIGAGLLPVTAVAGPLNVLNLAQSTPTGSAELGHDDLLWLNGGIGASGMRGLESTLSDQVLSEAGDPAKLAMNAGPLSDLPDGPLGIPGMALDAYRGAAATLAKSDPGCHLSWSLLASVGRIESGHAHGQFESDGTTPTPILGPELNGTNNTAIVRDTDKGRLDADVNFDRAVGPMQFIPGTWRKYGADGNGDGVANPNNIYDASLTAGKYLCASGGNLADPAQAAKAVFSYNPSDSYVRTVLVWANAYANGVHPVSVAVAPAGSAPAAPGRPAPQQPRPGSPSRPSGPGSVPPGSSNPGSSGNPPSSSTPPTTSPTCPALPTSTTTPPPSSSTTTPSPTTTYYPPGCPTPTPTPTPSASSAAPSPTQ